MNIVNKVAENIIIQEIYMFIIVFTGQAMTGHAATSRPDRSHIVGHAATGHNARLHIGTGHI